jgi:hypothetical protein
MAPGGAPYCYGGDLTSKTTVALVGDSHSSAWFREFTEVAQRQGVRVLLLSNPGCPFIPIAAHKEANGPDIAQCAADRNSGMALLSSVKPAAIVLTQNSAQYLGLIVNSSGNVPSQTEQVALWKHAFQSFIREESAMGVRVGVVLDNPTLPESPAECVSQTSSIAQCEPSRAVALGPDRLLGNAELDVLNRGHIPYVSPDTVLCNAAGCPIALNGKLLYVDANHLAYAGTHQLQPQLTKLFRSLLATHD